MLPEDIFNIRKFNSLKIKFINIISENKLMIAQTRYLFNSVLKQFEREVPIKTINRKR